ncbi:TetR-like C-terminal domain-containing protein [Streptomyces sp. NPDC093064]|uniref:TetR-like C-terminal domain-containing protein n=1 Tax=Streptomyces sp. NPDC093064 TaxID=3366020 RepID=UPI003802E14B
MGVAQTDAELAAQFDHHYFGPRRRRVFTLLEAAKERGQIRADADLGVLVDLIWGACYIRLLLPHLTDQLTPAFAHAVVDQALTGILTSPAREGEDTDPSPPNTA